MAGDITMKDQFSSRSITWIQPDSLLYTLCKTNKRVWVAYILADYRSGVTDFWHRLVTRHTYKTYLYIFIQQTKQMQLSGTFSNISDEELDELVRDRCTKGTSRNRTKDADRSQMQSKFSDTVGQSLAVIDQNWSFWCAPKVERINSSPCLLCFSTPCTLAHRWQSQVDKVWFVLNNGFMLIISTEATHVARDLILWV